MSAQTLLLVDGHSMAFRSFYALNPESFRTESGIYTNAVHGFANTLIRLVKEHQPSHVAIAFDLPGGTFRTRMYQEYKGGRKATPEEFKGQIALIQDLLDAIGVKWLTYDDYEADDIIATLSTRGAENGMNVVIASGDKDSYQLVNELVTVSYPMPRAQMLLLDPAGVEQRVGVKPEIYCDYAALVGEGADNIPGVPGVGPKTAAKWLNHYGSLSALLDSAAEIKGKVGISLRDNIAQIRLNRKLNALVRDLPIGADFNEFQLTGVDLQKFTDICDSLEFNSVRGRVLELFAVKADSAGAGESYLASGQSLAKVTDFPLREIRVLPANTKLTDFLQISANMNTDTNTNTEKGAEKEAEEAEKSNTYWGIALNGRKKPGAGNVQQMAIANNAGEVVSFVPSELNHADREVLVKWLNDPSAKKVGHGIKELMHALAGSGLRCETFSCCTELQAYLLHPERREYNFTDLVSYFLGVDIPAENSAETLGINLDGTLVHDQMLEFSAVQVLNLADVLSAKLQKVQNADLLELEIAVATVLFRMEDRGIAVDKAKLTALHTEFDARVAQAEHFAYLAIGDDSVNLSSPKQLQRVLFEELGLPKTKKTKSGYTTNADALSALLVKISGREDENSVRGQDFLNALLQHRDAIKLRQSVEGLLKAVQDDGRIHTTYQQSVAATGRLSSTDPNLQNIHARTEEGLQIREIFVPGAGYEALMTADYSQIEMRLMAHLSGDAELIQAFKNGADLHNYVASRVFGVPEDAVSSAQRSKIKAMSYGLVYGLSAYGLAAQLDLSVGEAQRLMDGYFSRFGKVKEYLDLLVERARKTGYTETFMGRRRYLQDLTSTQRQVRQAAERAALNAPIQGSAADLIKIAMCATEFAIQNAGLKSRILLQVHDELVLEVAAGESNSLREIVEREMGNAAELTVPLTVGVGVGKNWRAAAH